MSLFSRLSLAGCLLAAPIAYADTVTLTNSDRLSGTITAIETDVVHLQTDHLGELQIPIDQIAGIDRADPITVKTPDGGQITGGLANVDGRQTVTTDQGVEEVSVTDVAQAYEDYISAQDEGKLAWTLRADLGYLLTTGNSENETRSLHSEATAKQGKYEHRAFIGFDQVEADGETTKDQTDAKYRLRWYFRDRWFALGNVSYFQDKIKDIDQRITVGGGVGHTFWDNPMGALSAELGVSQVFEDLDGENESNPALRWALNWNRWLRPEEFELFHNHEILAILGSGRGQVLNASTGVRFHINGNWNTNLRVDLIHETEPLPGREKNDLTYVVGVGYVF